ncbi:MAG: prepilin-type N-terminal cleavage/methylation domain-containing protein [Bacillota bacterium]
MKRPDDAGFTLLEVIIAATLFTVVVLGYFLLLDRGVKDWFWTEEYTDALDNLRIGVDKMAGEVREASAIIKPVWGVPDNNLTLLDSTGENRVRYYVDSENELQREQIRLVDNKKSVSVVASRISSLSFSREPNSATIKIVIKAKAPKSEEISVQTSVYARNLK